VEQQNRVTAPDGTVHTFPAGTTPEQMAAALGLGNPTPEPSHATPPQGSALRRLAGNFVEGLNPITLAKGLYQGVRHPIDTFVTPTAESWGKVGPALKEGRYTDAANAAAGGIPLIGPASEAASQQWKGGDAAGAIGRIGAIIAGPKIYKGAGTGLKAAATDAAGLVLKADRGTRAAALQHSAMPGLLRSGAKRADARIASAEAQLAPSVAGASQAPVSLRRIAHSPKAWDEIQSRIAAGPGEAAANAVVDNLLNNVKLKPTPTVGGAATIAKGSYAATRGKAEPAAIMERAMADNAMTEIGRATGNPAAGVVRDLQGVANAYAQPAGGLPPGMAPTMNARLAIAAANRMIGPTTQNVYRAGNLMESMPANALRALMLQELLTRSGGER
jgi:hypothetical protein